MSITYVNDVKDDRMQVVIDAIDAGSGAGKLVIGTSALSGATGVLVEVELDDPCATTSAGVLTFAGLPKSGTATDTGTAAKAELRDSDDNVVASGLTVGTAGTDIILNTTAISTGLTVQITAATFTHG